MGQYLIKRLFYFIPTFLILLVLSFFLLQSIPGDMVEEIMDRDQFIVNNDIQSYAKQYDRISRQQGFNLPSFYFSILPQNQVSLFEVDSPLKRKIRKDWLGSFDVSSTNKAFDMAELFKQEFSQDSTSSTEMVQTVKSIPFSPVEMIPGIIIGLKKHGSEKMNGLATLLDQMQANGLKNASGWPSFVWHGKQSQFHQWIKGALFFDWGESHRDGRKVRSKIASAMKWTLLLSLLTLFFSVIIGVPLGLFASVKPRPWMSIFFFGLYAIPLFWLATMMIIFFTTEEYGSWTNIFPSAGIFVPGVSDSFLDQLLSQFKYLILPVLCLTTGTLAYLYRQMQANSLDEYVKPYGLSARAKGLSRKDVMIGHVSRNAVYPLIGLLATIIPGLIAGSLVVEVLFNIPGMGRLLLDAISIKDWNVVLGVIVVSAVFTFVGFIVADVLLYLLNPKVRYGR